MFKTLFQDAEGNSYEQNPTLAKLTSELIHTSLFKLISGQYAWND